MKGKTFKLVLFLVVLAALAFGYLELPTDSARREAVGPPPSTPAQAATQAPPSDGVLRVVRDVAVLNYGEVVYRGPIDLTPTIERIRAGIKHPHRNDGSVFGNRERRLPDKPRGYYREFVHPTNGIDGPGPQRLVVGDDGDWWYTPDHYASFITLGRETPAMSAFVYADDVRSVGVIGTHVAVVPSGIDSREELFRQLSAALRLPDYFGANWDALDECLRDLSWLDERRVVLFHEALPALERDPLKTYLEILRDAVLDWRRDVDDELVVALPPSAVDEVRQALG